MLLGYANGRNPTVYVSTEHHDSKLPIVSLIVFMRSKFPFLVALVNGLSAPSVVFSVISVIF